MVEYLHRKYYQPRKLQMRACHPRDLVEQVVDMCRYQNREPAITRELLDAACGSYFLEETESQGVERMKPVVAVAQAVGRRRGRPRRRAGLPTARRGRATARSSRPRSPSRMVDRRAVHVHGGAARRRLPADGPVHGLLLLASEALVVVLTVFRRADRRRRSQPARARADDAVAARPAARRAAAGAALAPEAVTVLLSALGLLVVIGGKVSLGRSFGLMPANRGVVSTGLYRLVRHPIYMGYLITHVGFLAANPTLGTR